MPQFFSQLEILGWSDNFLELCVDRVAKDGTSFPFLIAVVADLARSFWGRWWQPESSVYGFLGAYSPSRFAMGSKFVVGLV